MKNLKPQDMKVVKKNIDLVVLSVMLIFVIAYLFYKSMLAVLFVLPFGYLFFRKELQERKEKENKKIAKEFQEFLESLITNLQAGYSMENAIGEVRKDLKQIYGEQNEMVTAIEDMQNEIKNRIPMEESLFHFSKKFKVKEIEDFAIVYAIAKRSGGNLVKIIEQTSNVIQAKIEVDRDIQTLLSAKILESNIMNLVPILILFYISVTNPGYFDCMYWNVKGIVMMTLGLGVYAGAYLISKKILQIQL